MIITIPDYRTPSRNKTITSHWRTYQKYRDEMATLISAYATDHSEVCPAEVIIEAYYKGRRSVDTSNIDDKMIVDALMKVGILKDDTAYENPTVIKRVFPDSKKDELVILVIEVI